MGDRSTRRRAINPPPAPTDTSRIDIPAEDAAALRAAASAGAPDPAQDAIDRWAEAGDRMPGPTQTDTTTLGGAQARADASDPEFDEAYKRSVSRGSGYLERRRVSGNRSALVPPNAELHPRLKMWAFNYMGKWLILRWLNKRPTYAQKRFEQGWQYFEGREWCKRLGLNPENYLNEAGRIQTVDALLGWAAEEYVLDNEKLVRDKQLTMIHDVKENLAAQEGKYVPRVELISGSDEDVMSELSGRRRFAESRS